MRNLLRAARFAIALAIAGTAGTLPACGSMGGGGMHYLVEPPAFVAA